MNARQRRKIQKIKDGPWAARLWRGKAWHSRLGRWVKLHRCYETEYWMGIWDGQRGIHNALKRGAAYQAKRRSTFPFCLNIVDRWDFGPLITALEEYGARAQAFQVSAEQLRGLVLTMTAPDGA